MGTPSLCCRLEKKMTLSRKKRPLGDTSFNTTATPPPSLKVQSVRGDRLAEMASWCHSPHPATYFPAESLHVTILTAMSLPLFSKSVSVAGSEETLQWQAAPPLAKDPPFF